MSYSQRDSLYESGPDQVQNIWEETEFKFTYTHGLFIDIILFYQCLLGKESSFYTRLCVLCTIVIPQTDKELE